MTFDFWKKTGIIKPFATVKEYEKYEEDCIKTPKLDMYANTTLRKSKIKRGINGRSESFDSFFEFTFVQYMRLIKGYIVERNHKTHFLFYTDPHGKQCKFYPDFVVNGTYAEVKGRFTEKDHCKYDQHPEVNWYFSVDISQMRLELDSKIPDWKDDFIQTN